MKSEPNLAEKLCVENTLRETNLCAKNQVCVKMESWKRTLRLNVVLFIKFRKYKTAFNSGLKIWRVSGKSEMARLFNLKFFLYLWWLGVDSSPLFQSRETLWFIIVKFIFKWIFIANFNLNLIKVCVWNLETLCQYFVENLTWIFCDFWTLSNFFFLLIFCV